MEPPGEGASHELEFKRNLTMEPSEDKTSDGLKFHCNFARLPLITKEVYDIICAYDEWIREVLPREFLDYYVTALLWARLLHIKFISRTPLTATETNYHFKFIEESLPLPEPIYRILTMIGNIMDFPRGSGRNLYLSDHILPVAVRAGRGGYHSAQITVGSHHLFEEVPSLGVSGDCIMCLSNTTGYPTEPTFPFLPLGAEATLNMTGYLGPAGPITEGVSSVLTSLLSISADEFKEDLAGTRLNMDLIDYVSNIIQQSRAFTLVNFCMAHMSVGGSEVQVIQTIPVAQTSSTHQDLAVHTWTQRVVQARIMSYFNEECVYASYYTGFQLYKEEREGDHTNWCCVKSRDSFIVPTLGADFVENRNLRRYPIMRALCGLLWIMRSQSAATREYCKQFAI